MGKILCATRGGEASYRTQDAVIALAKEQNDSLVFLYVVDTNFISKTERAVRPDVVATEMEHMGEFLLAMACERAEKQGVQATPCVKHGQLDAALKEAAVEEGASLVVLGRPGGEESRFQLASLEKLAADIFEETGAEARII
jgi:nucleotide-binding universal stress UspA family protein